MSAQSYHPPTNQKHTDECISPSNSDKTLCTGQLVTEFSDSTPLLNQFGSMNVGGFLTSVYNVNDSFEVVIPSGPIFKSLCVFLESTSSSGHLVFINEGIMFVQYQKENIIVNRVEIFSHELPVFKFSSQSGTFALPISPSVFKKCLGKVPQKAEILLFKPAGTKTIGINILNHTPGTLYYNPVELEYEEYEIDEDGFSRENEPFCVTRSIDITKAFEQIIGTTAAYIIITHKTDDLGRFLLCVGYDTYGEYAGNWPLSSIHREPLKLISSFQINIATHKPFKMNISTIKALKLLSQLDRKSCIKFYVHLDENDNLTRLKIVSHVGSYGVLSNYIINSI